MAAYWVKDQQINTPPYASWIRIAHSGKGSSLQQTTLKTDPQVFLARNGIFQKLLTKNVIHISHTL